MLVVSVPPGQSSSALRAAVAERVPVGCGRAVLLVRVSPPTPASASVAHDVIDALYEAGCDTVTVGVVLDQADADRGHRGAPGLAYAAGLTGRTPSGRDYPVRDLRSDLVVATVPATSVLAGQRVSRLWAAADVRVVLGRVVTDLFLGYAATLAPLAGLAVAASGADPADVVADVVAHLPPHLALADATVLSHGSDGARLPLPLAAGQVLIAEDPVEADSAAARLLGEDRAASPLLTTVLRGEDGPAGPAGAGGPDAGAAVRAVSGVQRVHPAVRAAARALAAEPAVQRVVAAAIGGPDEGADPADPLLAGVRALATPLVAAARGPAGQVVLAGALSAVAALAAQPQAVAANLAKDRVRRRTVPLGFDPWSIDDAAYDTLPAFLAPFEQLLATLPAGGELRWCVQDGATVFETFRDVAADFDAFVARVDVAEGISLMADYLGGRRVEVGRRADGAVRQAERNLYLPQPNYLALAGGLPIDVCKIELVERSADEHRLSWRTVVSPNGSATWDDGILTLRRQGAGTRVTIRGRQLFALPPAWSAVDLAALPEVRDPLLAEAYRRFFTATFDNLEACFEGRPFRIGHDADPAGPLPTAALHQLLSLLRDVPGVSPAGSPAGGHGHRGTAPVALVDEHGFRHLRGRHG
ncbi:MAG TPA: hypothetical protein VI248_22505 [Kineosporiaceae bacterium]